MPKARRRGGEGSVGRGGWRVCRFLLRPLFRRRGGRRRSLRGRRDVLELLRDARRLICLDLLVWGCRMCVRGRSRRGRSGSWRVCRCVAEEDVDMGRDRRNRDEEVTLVRRGADVSLASQKRGRIGDQNLRGAAPARRTFPAGFCSCLVAGLVSSSAACTCTRRLAPPLYRWHTAHRWRRLGNSRT